MTTVECKKSACKQRVNRSAVDLSPYPWLTAEQKNEIDQRCPNHAQDIITQYVQTHKRNRSKNPFRK